MKGRTITGPRALLVAIMASVAGAPAASAQVAAGDSTSHRGGGSEERLITGREWRVAGGAVLLTAALAPLDRPIQHAFQSASMQHSRLLHHVAGDFALAGGPGPFVAGAALYAAGAAIGAPRAADVGVHLTEGVLVAAALDGLGKGLTGRGLPNAGVGQAGHFSFGRGFHDGNGPFVSFPSGHTAAGFATAAALTSETALWSPAAARIVGPLAYGGATMIGLARLYQNVHWASDLPLGAAIGTWSGMTAVEWQHSHPRSRLDRWLLGTIVAPTARRTVSIGWSSEGAASGGM